MGKYSSRKDTMNHIRQVKKSLKMIIRALRYRSRWHDASKLVFPELKYFDIYTPKLGRCAYGSTEYKQYLNELKPALQHHYENNRHHPEHHIDGIRGMSLVDIVEMFADWYASAKRHKDGSIMKSIEINQERFGYSDDIRAILENTAMELQLLEGK